MLLPLSSGLQEPFRLILIRQSERDCGSFFEEGKDGGMDGGKWSYILRVSGGGREDIKTRDEKYRKRSGGRRMIIIMRPR